MSGKLDHSAADILRWLLIDLEQGTDPYDDAAWPVYVDQEPLDPDNCLTVTDTTGRTFGRSAVDKEMSEHHGLQVRVRSTTFPVGFAKAREIARKLDEVLNTTVTVDSSDYCVHDFIRSSDVIPLGKEPSSERNIFTLNGLLVVRMAN